MGRSYTSRNSNSKAVHIHHEVTYNINNNYNTKLYNNISFILRTIQNML